MKCQYCGKEAAKDQKYCICCGTRLEVEQEPVRETTDWETVTQGEPAPEPELWPEEPVIQQWDPLAVQPILAPAAPALKLPTKRGLGKMVFLGLLTAGIYPTVIWSRIVAELNIAASRYDGKRTVSYFGACMLAPITLGIYTWVWMHNFCSRIGDELERRGFTYSFGAKTFWLWGVLGSLIVVGPFIFTHKLMKAMNQINEDFNEKG